VSAAYATDAAQPMEVEEEYDPARPNEYDRYLDERMRRFKEEREEEMYREREQDRDKDRDRDRDRNFSAPSESAPNLDLNITGDEAFNRRARLSARTHSSPPRVPPSPVSVDDDMDGEEMSSPVAAPATISALGPPKENVVARMMAKMGWKEGSGLGKEEQGMTTALMHKKTDRNTGIIVNAPPVSTNRPARAPVRFPPSSEQSKVLLLKNAVGPGEVDDDLESEIATECTTKYGEVVKCLIFEVTAGLVPPTEAVRIFVQFTRQEAAVKAFIDLNGRYFGGRAVNATFYSEERFLTNNLAPGNDELEHARNS